MKRRRSCRRKFLTFRGVSRRASGLALAPHSFYIFIRACSYYGAASSDPSSKGEETYYRKLSPNWIFLSSMRGATHAFPLSACIRDPPHARALSMARHFFPDAYVSVQRFIERDSMPNAPYHVEGSSLYRWKRGDISELAALAPVPLVNRHVAVPTLAWKGERKTWGRIRMMVRVVLSVD